MATSSDLQFLCDELTQAMPPPRRPMGSNFVIEGTGKWVIVRVGSGVYAVRAEYDDVRGGSIVVKMENEISGFAPMVTSALKFAVSVANSHKFFWQAT